MEAVTKEKTATMDSVQAFWKSLHPGVGAEKPWLFHREKGKTHSLSWKDVQAQAHCIAAYLMDKGHQPGESVGIMASGSPFYLVVDLAVQFLGGTSCPLPLNLDKKTVEKVVREHKMRFFFTETREAYLNLNQLRDFQEQLVQAIVKTDDAEGLEPGKLVTFDRVVVLGKVPWREQVEELQNRKAAVKATSKASVEHGKKDFSYQQLMDATARASSWCKEKGVKVVATLSRNGSLNHRTFAGWAAMQDKMNVHSTNPVEIDLNWLAEVKPQILVLEPDQVETLLEALEAICRNEGGSWLRGWEKTIKVREKRKPFVDKGEKVPLFVRMSFNSLQRGFFVKLKKLMGGQLTTLVVDPGKLNVTTQDFFTDFGLEIYQP